MSAQFTIDPGYSLIIRLNANCFHLRSCSVFTFSEKKTFTESRMASYLIRARIIGGDIQTWLASVLTVLLFIVLTLNFKAIISRLENRWKLVRAIDKFPGPLKLPFIGNAHLGLKLRRNEQGEFQEWMRTMVKTWGPLFRIWKLDKPCIFISSADLAINLLKDNVIDDKSEDVKTFSVAIQGVGLTALSHEIHPKHKKLWNKFFNWRQLKCFLPRINDEGLKLVSDIGQFAENDLNSNGQVFDLLHLAIRCTFNITCCSAFGSEFVNTISNEIADQYIRDLHRVCVNLTRREFRPLLTPDLIYYNTPAGKETKICAERGANLIKEAIAFRRNKRKCMDQKPQDNEMKCFVDHMLDLHEQGILTEDQLVGELNVFFAGGVDTSGAVIGLVVFHLSLYPEHQEKVLQELINVLGSDFDSNNNYSIDWHTVKMFKHLELCIKECLRLYPLVPVLPRRTTQNIKLGDGRVIPQGVDTFIITDIIHRDPKYFPDPDEFRPERHKEGPIPAFMPFSFGTRNCIGQVLAMVTMKTIIAQLIMAYRWQTTETKDSFKCLYQTLQVPESVKCKIRKRVY
ncbi:unnamed protein product [Orchesella dallaii]|uniref:Cytochrome P450 4V2 n=1 Tax=Orchesella dallaii TaxID=48710 RepID=A0ABP1QJ41_9HEXA